MNALAHNPSREATAFPGAARRGFTLIELLVVVALLAFGALTLLPAMARARPGTRASQCLNNLRQLSCGTMMYIADNRDCFPGPASRNTYGFVVEDWIYWRTGAGYPPLSKSPVIAGFGSSATNLFRCPADRDDSDRILFPYPPGPYMASYCMTSLGWNGGTNLGMTSIFSSGYAYLFKLSQVRNPGRKIMLAEPQASLKPGEASNPGPDGSVIFNGRWVPPADDFTVRHDGGGNVSFADGHAATVTPRFAIDPANNRPDF